MTHRLLLLTLLLLPLSLAHAGTREEVQRRGTLRCGVTDLPAGVEIRHEDFGMLGFHIGICRAVAAAVLGDADAVDYLPLTAQNRFLALRQGEVDLLVGSNTVTSSRDSRLGLNFGPIVFFDGAQGFAPAVRHGDDEWLDTVTWIVYALIQAEEWGIGSEDVGLIGGQTSLPGPLERFFGFESSLTDSLGLPRDALRRVIEQVGNYGELYRRHLGEDAAAPIPRGPNRLWFDGGRLISPPFSSR